MLTVIHTFNSPDKDRLMADIRTGLDNLESFHGFKYASINEQTNTNDIMVITKWKSMGDFQNWADTLGENKAFKQATPQQFSVIEEKH